MDARAGEGGEGGDGSADAPIIQVPQGEFWLAPTADDAGSWKPKERVHVRFADSQRAVVTFGDHQVQGFTITTTADTLGSDPIPFEPGVGGMPRNPPTESLRGPIVLTNPKPDTENAVSQIAFAVNPDGTLADTALIHRLGRRVCLQGQPWLTSHSTVVPDTEGTSVEREIADLTPESLLPWEAVTLAQSKPSIDALGDSSSAHTAQGKSVGLHWFADESLRARVTFDAWPQLFGQVITLSGSVANSNGAGADGRSTWSTAVQLAADPGAAREGDLDFNAGMPAGLADLGATFLSKDLACGTDAEGQPRSCLQIDGTHRLLVRFKGSLTNLHIHASVKVENDKGASFMQPSVLVDLGMPDGSVISESRPLSTGSDNDVLAVDSAFDPVDEVIVALSGGPALYSNQTDLLGCGKRGSYTLYIDSIEPVAP